MLNGRCILPIVVDVVATVADGIATFVGMFNCGRCYYYCGRWNSHFCWNVSLWQMLLPLWQME